MDSVSKTNRACAVAAAAAHEFNNELTVILNSISGLMACLPPEPESRAMLLDLQAAAQRCVWKASGLLNFSARVSPGRVYASFEYLIDE